MNIHFGWLLVLGLYKKNPVNQFNHNSLGAVGTPSDLPKLFRNCCVIEVLVAFSCCHFIFFSVGKGFLSYNLSQNSSFLSAHGFIP